MERMCRSENYSTANCVNTVQNCFLCEWDLGTRDKHFSVKT